MTRRKSQTPKPPKTPRATNYAFKRPHPADSNHQPRPPAAVVEERDRAMAARTNIMLDAVALGDPLPGRSALDRRQPGNVVSLFKGTRS